MLMEQTTDEAPPNIALDIEKKIDQDTGQDTGQDNQKYETAREDGDDKEEEEVSSPKDRTQRYRISGGILALHGKNKTDTDITTDDKLAFQETMDEFVEEVSDLVDFNTLNVYPNNVDWSGKIIDEDFLETINKLQQYYQKFKSKWSRILASRKKTGETND